MKKYVVITGGSGRIGTAICKALPENKYNITLLDRKPSETDHVLVLDIVKESLRLKNTLISSDAIIHLAWDSRENWKSGIAVPENKTMIENVYQCAKEAGVRRVIMASSIHADARFYTHKGEVIKTDIETPEPDSPYGATKLWMEALGRQYAKQDGLEVICIRFGGLTPDNTLRPEPLAEKIWLHTEDCVSLVKTCIDAPEVPGNFCIIYGISNNTSRIHDLGNPFGWVPKHDFAK